MIVMMMVYLGLHFCSAGWVGWWAGDYVHALHVNGYLDLRRWDGHGYGYGYALAYVDGTAYFWVRRRAVYLDTYGGLLCSCDAATVTWAAQVSNEAAGVRVRAAGAALR